MLSLIALKLHKITGHRRYASRNFRGFEFLLTSVKSSIDESKLPPRTKIDKGTIELLEKLSFVGIEDKKGIQIVEDAVRFADGILEVETKGVEPLISVLEDYPLMLREDKPENELSRTEILSHSKVTADNYFVTPLSVDHGTQKDEVEKVAQEASENTKLLVRGKVPVK